MKKILAKFSDNSRAALLAMADNGKHSQIAKNAECIFVLSRDLIGVLSIEGRFVRVNPAFERTLGYSAEELLAETIHSYVHTDDLPVLTDGLNKLAGGSEIDLFVTRLGCKDTSYRWISWQAVLAPGAGKYYLFGRDITRDMNDRIIIEKELKSHREDLEEIVRSRTEALTGANAQLQQEIAWRKETELALRMSERRFRTAFEYSAVGMALVSPAGRLLEVNRVLCHMIGYSEKELLRMTVQEITHPDDLAEQAECINELLTGIIISYQLEKRYIHKYGHAVWVSVAVSLVRDAEGQPLYLIAQIQNLTQRKKTEKALRMTEDRFSRAFHSNPCMMAIARLSDGVYLDVNASFSIALGYAREEIIGRTVANTHLWTEPEKRKLFISNLRETGKVRDMEIRYNNRLGEGREGILSADIVDIDGDKCILSVIYDITERRKMEKELTRLERLNLVGQMAAGIGHEIRNPLTTVRGFLQFLKSREGCRPYTGHFDVMIEELDRANSIITEFLSLAGNKSVEFQRARIHSIVEAVYPLLRADALEAGKDVLLELEITPELMLNEKEIRQVILNLVRNGLEAMPPGGIVTVLAYTEGSEVVLAVRDTGPGIRPELLDKLGTPFLTTKDQGTGLGLPICFSIANRHKAKITVDSGQEGTTFYIRFDKDRIN